MEEIKREWGAYSPAEKLIAIDAYLDGMAKLDDADEALNNERLEWLRAHLPAYDPKGGKNYIFISYSHLDYKDVYRDLAYFSYNSQRRVRFWYDEGLPVGTDWEAAAGKFMADKHCVGVIFYLSKNLLLSPSVFKEIQAVKKYNKPYFAVALNGGEYFAEKILQKATEEEQLSVREKRKELADFFPENNTAITYYEDTAFARINTISRFFDVTEEVFADFVCEECEDGLVLKNYCGNEAEIRIPESIDGKPIVEIDADFFDCTANSVYIPKTIKRIFVVGIYSKNNYCDFEKFIVDKENPFYYDINGVLCEKTGVIIRAPRRWNWKKQFEPVADSIKMQVFNAASIKDLEGRSLRKRVNIQIDIRQFRDIISFCFDKDTPNNDINLKVKAIRGSKSLFYKCCLDLKQKSLFCGINKIDETAFCGCTSVDYLFLPDTIEIIEKHAFETSNCKLICLPENLEVISKHCFANCVQLSAVLTNCNFENYGSKYNISDALLFGKIANINSSAFSNTFIEHLILSEEIINVEDLAFSDCTFLKFITFTSTRNLYSILENAFTGCGSLLKIFYNGTISEWTSKLSIVKNIGYASFELLRATIVCTDGVIPPAEED